MPQQLTLQDVDDPTPTLDAILASGGLVYVIGAQDAGKSTFSRLLLRHAAAAGRSACIIDADPAQPEFGPPLCIGLAGHEADPDNSGSIASAFIGAVSPAACIPEYLSALGAVSDAASRYEMRIVDTPGLVYGASARRLHQCAINLLNPAHVVALQKGAELGPIIAAAGHSSRMKVHHLAISASVSARPPAFRAQRLAMRFSAYFDGAAAHVYPMQSVGFASTWLGGGSPLAPHLFKYLSTALADYTRLFYAEQYGRHLGLMVSRPVPEQCVALGIALEQFGAREVTVTPASTLKNLVVGLQAANGKLLGLGRITTIDFKRRTVTVSTPIRTPSAVELVRFGYVRVGADGAIQGSISPGEL